MSKIKFLMAFLLTISLTGFICEPKEEEEESRLYLEEKSPNYFTALYVVNSPKGSQNNWGENIVSHYEILQGYGWKKYTFDPGTYDIKVVWHIPDGTRTSHQEFSQKATDSHGRMFTASSNGVLFITDFRFDH